MLTSKPYLERLDNPTPMTRTIMAEVFINMNRTVCRRTVRRGRFRGAFAVVARFSQKQDEAALTGALERFTANAASLAAKSGLAVDAGRHAGVDGGANARRRQEDCGALMIETLYQDEAEGSARNWPSNSRRRYRRLSRALPNRTRSDL